MLKYECRLHSRIYPREGELVIARVSSIDTDGLTLDLLEYGDVQGLVLLGELSKKRVRTIQQVTKVGCIEICLVIKVDEEKGHVDLSMSKVTDSEKASCKEASARNKLAYYIMAKASRKLEIPVSELYENMGYEKEVEYGSLYCFFAKAKDNEGILADDEIGMTIKELIKEQFQASTYKVRADVDVLCAAKGGVEAIKNAFEDAILIDPKLEFNLIKTPTYSITRVSSSKDKAYESVSKACEALMHRIAKEGGTATVVSQARLYGEKTRHSLLNFEDEEKKLPEDESSSNEEDSEQ
ncbi:subunit alpha of translation initiation factor 2 [Ordospora colligata]|uniref:Subunit alpha of translation initiation factor 2 n=1 Tax=Ordospora colligata OC4 TaxID=1354746 RepID=A0A0B2UI23_9MICR|nr:subunit alpha of translation initiation factor 2 [Ordospora colligata OC4]KHN68859.1 subunit alpha of translation initiation factor 2 [Ordospora colligata OC4]TBU13893.1 subunit alpha of translation initiation factor 2 [Ordospora colligata]TBU14082.1 subunit alpha of translation initiation factor 2 [Ordospora colligata]TBU17751.1 subunit alpha of translation initiation factor 2 [Ordospora colligata]